LNIELLLVCSWYLIPRRTKVHYSSAVGDKEGCSRRLAGKSIRTCGRNLPLLPEYLSMKWVTFQKEPSGGVIFGSNTLIFLSHVEII
jgi:hypothetical protein